jgi:phosphoglucomutase
MLAIIQAIWSCRKNAGIDTQALCVPTLDSEGAGFAAGVVITPSRDASDRGGFTYNRPGGGLCGVKRMLLERTRIQSMAEVGRRL